jgi:hypothetical protein
MHAELQNVLDDFKNFEVNTQSVGQTVIDAKAHINGSSRTATEKASAISTVDALKSHYDGLVSMIDGGTLNSFGSVWFYLKNQEQQILNNPLLSEEVKQSLLAYNSLIRNYLKYQFGRGEFDPPAEERAGDDCFLGVKIKCWLRYGIISLLKITAYVAAIFVSYSPYLVLLIIAEVTALITYVALDDCFCTGGTSLNDIIPCRRPDFVNVELSGCSMTQKLSTYGYGDNYNGTFIWELEGATLPATGNAQNIVSETTTPTGVIVETNFPWVVATQTAANNPVFVKVSLKSCNTPDGGDVRPGFFNFNDLTSVTPGTITVAKKSPETTLDHVVQISTEHNYFAYGTAVMQAGQGLYNLAITPNNYGSIVPTAGLGLGEVRVKWNLYTFPQSPYTYLGKVTATVFSNGSCNVGNTRSDDIKVAVQLP